MRCWAIRLPMTTNAIPTSSLVPWIITLHTAPSSVDGPETAIWAFEMVAASLRLQPTLPMRWPTTASGIHSVQRTLGGLSGSEVEDNGECEGGGSTMWCYQSFLTWQRAWGTSCWPGSLGATQPEHGLVAHVGWGPSGICRGTRLSIRRHGHWWAPVRPVSPLHLADSPLVSLLTLPLQSVPLTSSLWLLLRP
jgi:hypothetical protein